MVEVEGTSNEFETLPSKRYHVQVTKCEVNTSKTGNPNTKWEGEVINDPEYTGRKLFWNGSLTPQAAWKLEEIVKGFKIPHQRVELGEKKFKIRFDTDDALGKTGYIAVSVEPAKNADGSIKEGKTNNSCEEFIPDES